MLAAEKDFDVSAPAQIEASELVQEVVQEQPDLVLLDLGLPRMSGFDVLEHIRRQGDIPVIVLTALDTEDDKVKALMMGADDYLPKPFGNRELQARIVAVLRRYRLIATGTTGRRISEATGLPVECLLSGPLGGDLQIGARIAQGEVAMVIFLRDPLTAHPHEPDIAALVKACDVHNVPFATNTAGASILVRALEVMS